MHSSNKISSVTALLPAWKSADFIQATLDSLSAQIYNNFQVVVSVDYCTDNTYNICLDHASRDPRFRVLRQNSQLGYVGNCNFLLNQADSDYVLFTFHDDIIDPNYISRLVQVLDEQPEVILSYSDLLLTEENGDQRHIEFSALDRQPNRLRRGIMMSKPIENWWVPNRGLFRLEPARLINGLKSRGPGEISPDWPWLFHMSLLGEFCRVPETLCIKYFKTDSLSQNWSLGLRHLYNVRSACMRELWHSPSSLLEKAIISLSLFYRVVRDPLRIFKNRLIRN